MERHPEVQSVSVGVWVRVGSFAESLQHNGISHFIEHMLFKGTQTRTAVEIVGHLERLGGEINAFTDREYTCYHACVSKQHIDTALDVLSDLVIRAQFPAHEVERERKVLLQELAMVEETPEEWIHDLFCGLVWEGEPLGLPVIGTRKSIKHITRARLLRFFQEYYRPENIVISVAGDIDSDAVLKAVERYFTFSTLEKTLPIVKKPTRYHSRRRSSSMESEQLHLLVGYEGVGFRDPFRYEMILLSYLLGGGISSRLFQEIREKAALAYTVECDSASYAMAGLLNIYVAMAPRSWKRCLAILSEQLKRVREERIPEEELERVKGQVCGAIELSSDSMEARQESIGRNEIIFGRYIPITEVVEKIHAVTPERVRAFCEKTFLPSKESVVTLGRVRMKASQLRVCG